MYQKIFRIIFIITFILGITFLIKPVYFYSKGSLIQLLLIDSWDEYKNKRVKKYSWFNFEPIGKLIIPKISLEYIVLDGTGYDELSYGLGKVDDSALLHEKNQNIIIAGHRDSFFKKLKYISKNDQIILEHVEGESVYIVENIIIVSPFESKYITNNKRNSLILITCFPFNFIGDAPKRFIVECNLLEN